MARAYTPEMCGPPAPCYLVCRRGAVLAVTHNSAEAEFYRRHGFTVLAR